MVHDESHAQRLEAQLTQARELLQRHILERVEAEEALRASEERFGALIERAAYGIFLAAPDGRFLDVNPALVEMLEYAGAEALREANVWRDAFEHAEEGERVRAAAANDSLPTWIEARWRRHGGAPLDARLSLRAVRNGQSQVVLFEGIAEDVTDRRRQEELVRRSERMATLGGTIAGVAHELNNPLAAIMGFAQILLTRPLAQEDREAVETINEEAARTARIVRDLLLLLRRREQEDRSAVDLNDVAGHVVRTRREERGTPVTLRLEPGLPAVRGDRSQLEQVVSQLLLNAEQAVAEATPTTAPIEVRTRRDGDEVVLEVEDRGPGIADEDLPRIWDPFWTTRAEGSGTGLGLSVVHSVVTQHGGFVEARNVAGGGARLTVRLPALGDAPPGAN